MDTLIKNEQANSDPLEDSFLDMDAGKITLAKMQHWLSGQGVTISIRV
jgi:hypothetical protein